MEIGDKVKTIYGNIETVMSVEEARITTFEGNYTRCCIDGMTRFFIKKLKLSYR